MTLGKWSASLFGTLAVFGLGGCVSPTPTPLFTSSVATESEPAACERQPRVDPLVTEWPASEKAHLQSLLAQQPVAVVFDGCELQLLDECRLPGRYYWEPRPIETHSLAIDSKDQLERELPIGGFRLESELKRNGELIVRTTVSGRFQLEDPTVEAPDLGPCAHATHLITGLSVGAFSLVGRAKGTEGGAVQGPIGEAVARESRAEQLLREAGIVSSCDNTTDTAPEKQCASPIRVFLAPLSQAQPKTRLERARRVGEVLLEIPVVEGDGSRWNLHNTYGTVVCELPCAHWVKPASGYFLRQAGAGGSETIPISGGFPVAPGERAIGVYHRERGQPDLSRWTFYGVGAPLLILGGLMSLAGGLVLATGDEPNESGVLVAGVSMALAGGASYWWYDWSHEGYFEVKPSKRAPADPGKPPTASLRVGLGSLRGSY